MCVEKRMPQAGTLRGSRGSQTTKLPTTTSLAADFEGVLMGVYGGVGTATSPDLYYNKIGSALSQLGASLATECDYLRDQMVDGAGSGRDFRGLGLALIGAGLIGLESRGARSLVPWTLAHITHRGARYRAPANDLDPALGATSPQSPQRVPWPLHG